MYQFELEVFVSAVQDVVDLARRTFSLSMIDISRLDAKKRFCRMAPKCLSDAD